MSKFIVCLFIFIGLQSQIVVSSSNLSFQGNIGFSSRLDGPGIESGYDSDRKPSMSDFYNGSLFYEVGFEYALVNKDYKRSNGHFYFGFSFLNESLEIKKDRKNDDLEDNKFDDILGNQLDIKMYSFHFGYAYYKENGSQWDYYFLSIGYSIPEYSGEGRFTSDAKSGDYQTKYESDPTYNVNLGSSLLIGNNFSMKYGLQFTPVVTNPYQGKYQFPEDHHVEHIESNYNFYDHTIKIKVGISYHL